MRGGRPALVALALGLAACGGASEPEPLDAYVEAVNRVQREAAPRFTEANTAFREFADGDLKGRKAAFALRKAELEIAEARLELMALRPPPEARRLHELVLNTYKLDVLMAADTRQMAIYQQQSEKALKPLVGLRKRLRRGLNDAGDPAGQVRALRTYATGVDRIRRRLLRLRPPALLTSSRDTQLTLMRRAGPLARQLAGAIERRDPDAVTRLARRFRAAGVSPAETRRATRGSILAYRQRLKTISDAEAAARSELARLVRPRL